MFCWCFRRCSNFFGGRLLAGARVFGMMSAVWARKNGCGARWAFAVVVGGSGHCVGRDTRFLAQFNFLNTAGANKS